MSGPALPLEKVRGQLAGCPTRLWPVPILGVGPRGFIPPGVKWDLFAKICAEGAGKGSLSPGAGCLWRRVVVGYFSSSLGGMLGWGSLLFEPRFPSLKGLAWGGPQKEGANPARQGARRRCGARTGSQPAGTPARPVRLGTASLYTLKKKKVPRLRTHSHSPGGVCAPQTPQWSVIVYKYIYICAILYLCACG